MEVKAFKAFRYDKKVVGDVGDCIGPPYDVIKDEQQRLLYEKNEYNIVRIIKGKTNPSDDAGDNQYTRAANYLKRWIEDGVLKRDPEEAIYGYVQDFVSGGKNFQRLCFIGLGRLEEFGKTVRGHEETLDKPMIDRLELKRATCADFGLVFMLYEDENEIADKIIEHEAVNQSALIDLTDEQDVRHRLFMITDSHAVEAILAMMKEKSCVIADGHHRYKTGLKYSEESSNPAAKYQMAAFCNTRQDGLVVLATHRLLKNLEGFSSEKLLGDLEQDFAVESFAFSQSNQKTDAKQQMLDRMKTEYENDGVAFGIYTGCGVFHVAVLKDKKAMDRLAAEKSSAWRSLDVAILHKLLLEKLLSIDEEKLAKGENLEYVKDTPDAIEESIGKVDAGERQAAFFLNPPKIKQIQDVAEHGEKMPQKSTYFYPKVFTGLTINKL